MTDPSLLIDRQTHQYGLISRTIENLDKKGKNNITKAAVETRLTQLEKNWDKFEATHEELFMHSKEIKYADNPYFTEDLYATCEEAYLSAKTELKELLSTYEVPSTSHQDNVDLLVSTASSTRTGRSLPKIILPTFSGKCQDWTPFRDMFLSMVGSNADLTPVEKLHYLKTNVVDDAAKVIAGIPVTGDNYERAWTKLQTRYENKRVLVNTQLDILFSLKPVQKRCARELENLRSTVQGVLEALQSLGAEVSKWDYFIVYFVCRLLDSETLEDWEMEIRGSMDPPAYQELNDFLDGSIRALENVSARLSGVKKPIQQASKTTSSARVFTPTTTSPCVCCGANHFVNACPTYKAKSPEQRREFVTAKKLRYNCLGSHRLNQCTSVKRCIVCRQPHHTTIHVRSGGNAVSADSPINAHSSVNSHQRSTTSAPNSLSPAAAPFNPNFTSSPGLSGAGTSASVNHAFPASPQKASSLQTLLPTAVINVLSEEGQEFQSRALSLVVIPQLPCLESEELIR